MNTTESINPQDQFEDDPPEMTAVFLKKQLNTGTNSNSLMKVHFDYYQALPDSMILFAAGQPKVFRDDGIFPDSIANDNDFIAEIDLDYIEFLAEIASLDSRLTTMGKWPVFEGHSGRFETEYTPFDVGAFNEGAWSEVDVNYIKVGDCNSDLVFQKSLLITDLSVVEDPLRTFNFVTGVGNPTGLYTFGNLMKNMANESSTGVSARTFVRKWLKTFITSQTISYPGITQTINPRATDHFLNMVIVPWINKANGMPSRTMTVANENWESIWDNTTEAELLKYAPFKLTAIANRLDLKSNLSYLPSMNKGKAGETRFVFTLLNLYDEGTEGAPDFVAAGHPPQTPLPNQGVYAPGAGFTSFNNGGSETFLDWVGMNVIFEYLNVQTSHCALHTFAHDWLNLSEKSFGESYNLALESLTETVILSDADPQNFNGSAIGRIRTNEKIFSATIADSGPKGIVTWGPAAWQFRQFEIEPNHHLENKPLENTPIFDYAKNELLIGDGAPNGWSLLGIPSDLTEWAYTPSNKWQIDHERHQIPAVYNGVPLLEFAGNISQEYAMYWDLDYTATNATFDPSVEVNGGNLVAKKLRQKLSLNTCQGCHSGENKTFFTHIAPLGYGEEADYWSTTPSTRAGFLDVRNDPSGTQVVQAENIGETLVNPSLNLYEPNYQVPATQREIQDVSAFITGRYYDGSATNPWEDDSDNPKIDELQDDDKEGLYFVNDPSNVQNGSQHDNFGNNNMQNGFNELVRRRDVMCILLTDGCSPKTKDDPLGFMRALDVQPPTE